MADSRQSLDESSCTICQGSLNLPFKLACHHEFCFLCIKAWVLKSETASSDEKSCPLCRFPILTEYITNPSHPEAMQAVERDLSTTNWARPQWFYLGDKGLWRYDRESSSHLENAYAKKKQKVTLTILGNNYFVDLREMVRENSDLYTMSEMCQYRLNGPSRGRLVKRCVPNAQNLTVQGIAGLPIRNMAGEDGKGEEVE